MQAGSRRRYLPAIKLALGVALLTFLVWQAAGHEQMQQVIQGKKDWPLLAAAAAAIATAIMMNFFRWRLLVHAAGLPMTVSEALRLGSLGYAVNLVGLGSVGGDVLKAALFARSHPGQKRVAVTTILADRFLGLLSLLAVAAVAAVYALCTDLVTGQPVLQAVIAFTLVSAVVSWTIAGLAFLSGPHSAVITSLLPKLPAVGSLAHDMFAAVQTIGRHPAKVPLAIVMGCVTHVMLLLSFYFVSLALPLAVPSFGEQATTVPLAELAGALPLLPGGLGVTEGALEALWLGIGYTESTGTLVALGQRLVNIAVGMVSLGYYLTRRGELPRIAPVEAGFTPSVDDGAPS